MGLIEINEQFEEIIRCAVKYSLSKKTDVVDDICDFVSANLDKLSEKTIKGISRDITHRRADLLYSEPLEDNTYNIGKWDELKRKCNIKILSFLKNHGFEEDKFSYNKYNKNYQKGDVNLSVGIDAEKVFLYINDICVTIISIPQHIFESTEENFLDWLDEIVDEFIDEKLNKTCKIENDNKTAKEMFEELGYKYCHKPNNCLHYFTKRYGTFEHVICLNTKDKTYQVNGKLDISLHKAINKQIEELGWNND